MNKFQKQILIGILLLIIFWPLGALYIGIAAYNKGKTEKIKQDLKIESINTELDEIEASLNRVRASEQPGGKVTAIWSIPKKK